MKKLPCAKYQYIISTVVRSVTYPKSKTMHSCSGLIKSILLPIQIIFSYVTTNIVIKEWIYTHRYRENYAVIRFLRTEVQRNFKTKWLYALSLIFHL